MKSKTKLIILGTCLTLIFTITLVYATNAHLNDTNQEPLFVSQESIDNSKTIFESLNSDTTDLSSKVIFDQLDNKNYYVIENKNYSLKLNTDNSLKGIYTKIMTTELDKSSSNKESAKNYIINKYAELNLPKEYELNYLEKYDDLIWLATFEKNYDGIYNKFESVKTYFIPDCDEIIALTIFNESPTSTKAIFDEKDAINVTLEKLNLEEKDVVSTSLEMEKGENSKIYASWIITTSDGTVTFVDANTNNIIGGDYINE